MFKWVSCNILISKLDYLRFQVLSRPVQARGGRHRPHSRALGRAPSHGDHDEHLRFQHVRAKLLGEHPRGGSAVGTRPDGAMCRDAGRVASKTWGGGDWITEGEVMLVPREASWDLVSKIPPVLNTCFPGRSCLDKFPSRGCGKQLCAVMLDELLK
jgi:hypothetical protein